MYTNLALSLLPCRVGAAVPGAGWSCRGTVTHPPEVRSGRHAFPLRSHVALQRWGRGLERGRQKPKGGRVPPTPGEPASPAHESRTPPALPKPHESVGRGWVGGKGARTRFERFLPKPPASYPAGPVLPCKASAPSPPPHPPPRSLEPLSATSRALWTPTPTPRAPSCKPRRLRRRQHPRGMCATSSWNYQGRRVSPG